MYNEVSSRRETLQAASGVKKNNTDVSNLYTLLHVNSKKKMYTAKILYCMNDHFSVNFFSSLVLIYGVLIRYKMEERRHASDALKYFT